MGSYEKALAVSVTMAASRRGDGDSPPASALKPPNCKCYTADSMGGETRLNKMATGKTQIPQKALNGTS